LYESKRQISESDSNILGERFCQLALESIKGTKPIIGGKGPYYWSLNVRGNSSSMYKMMYHDKEIGSMSDSQVFKEAYIGAIYHHISNTFTVKAHGNNAIILEKSEPHLVSEPIFFTIIQSDQIYNGFRFDEKISIYYGNVTIIDTLSGYKIVDKRNENIIEEQRTNKAKASKAHAFWIKMEDEQSSEGALKAVENMFRVGAIFVIPTDRYDTSTFCKPKEHEIYFYENYTGGIGVSEKALTAWREVLKEGIVIAENCSCKKGCPKCIHPPKLKDATMIDKEQGLILAKNIISISNVAANEKFDKISYAWKEI
jgi:DEAD/DEAH box helicase domain-containing protein